MYKNSSIAPESKWPPTPSREYIKLAMVEGGRCRENYIGHTLKGNIKEVLGARREIAMDEILADDSQRLTFIEGAPGIGKSTLAWELCRQWEELSCMKRYSLVILLRLREKEVQQISSVSDLFCSYESAERACLVDEVLKNQGNGILFILDGFDELPKALQEKSFLHNLIAGTTLPSSAVVVTSRPSATASLRLCWPLIQNYIEILGFTQEGVEAYASSIFSSQPQVLQRFKAYISASKSPAINSLMYIPLNAAIVVEIYRHCKSDSLVPHTMTELYTQLCLTYLNRSLSIRVDRIEDLPSDLYEQFCQLAILALNGIVKQEVIFHNIPNLVHFGFLDAVSALYGSGGTSYNFLHLTIQEFFAAYCISYCMPDKGLEWFMESIYPAYSKLDVTWQFVAGLTKFEHYKSYNVGHKLSEYDQGSFLIDPFFVQCIFEAQSIDNFDMDSLAPTALEYVSLSSTPLSLYALGYCIANFRIASPWTILLNSFADVPSLMNGLSLKQPNASVVGELHLYQCSAGIDQVLSSPVLYNLTCLGLVNSNLTIFNLYCLSKVIPQMVCLKELNISRNAMSTGHSDCLLKILQHLPHSNVTVLNISDIGLAALLQQTPQEYHSIFKELMHPSSGCLDELHISEDDVDITVIEILTGPSSLRILEFSAWQFPLPDFGSNTCITKLILTTLYDQIDMTYYCIKIWMPHIVNILRHNKTLQHLEMYCRTSLHDIESIMDILEENNALKSFTILPSSDYCDDDISRDPRIKILTA